MTNVAARHLGWSRAGLILLAVAALELACRTGLVSRQVIIAPSLMATTLWDILRTGRFNHDISQTLACVAAALVLSAVVGFAAGVALHALPRLRQALDPLLATYYAVPFFVFYPVLIVIFGLGQGPVITVAFLFAVVAMVINTLNGLDRIPRVLTKVARIHHLPPLSAALRLKLPAAAPHLFTGLKLAVAYVFIGVIASEFIMAASGLGYQISYAYNNFDNRTMYALMLLVIVVVTAANMVLHVWEQRVLSRRRSGG
jgi:NitT/TauT family transport system permease protein